MKISLDVSMFLHGTSGRNKIPLFLGSILMRQRIYCLKGILTNIGRLRTASFLVSNGQDFLIPFQHEHFELWTQSLHFGAKDRLNFVHTNTNLKVGGGLDDVWLNINSNCLHIVDYKSTSQKSDKGPITLDDFWKASYKRQMDLYVWVLRKKGFHVDDTGYFLYCDGDRFSDYDFLSSTMASMKFKMTLIEYQTNETWIEPTLNEIRECLHENKRPEHSERCEYGKFLAQSLNE